MSWVRSHRVEALGTAGLMMALAFVVIGGLIWTDQGRDLLQSANDWYRGLILFSGLTVSLVILEGLILLLIKKDREQFYLDRLAGVGALSSLIMGLIASFHNNVLVGLAVSLIGLFVGPLIPAVFSAFLDISKPITAGIIGFLAGLILFCFAVAPNFFGDWIGSALALTLVILGWLFLIFALATLGYISGNSGRGTKFILYGAASVWAVKSIVVLLVIWVRGYPILDYVRYDSSEAPAQVLTLDKAYFNWKAEAGDDKPTLVLVGAAGGGIRASFWTSLIMTRLADNGVERGIGRIAGPWRQLWSARGNERGLRKELKKRTVCADIS